MSLRLFFRDAAIPRTTTREEWRKIDRWRRVTQQEMAKRETELIDVVCKAHAHMTVFGSAAILYEIANPPLVIYP